MRNLEQYYMKTYKLVGLVGQRKSSGKEKGTS